MNVNKMGIISAIAISASALLVGCGGGQVDEGRMDLSELQKKAKVIAVEGNIYGIRPGTLDRVVAYKADRRTLRNYGDEVVEAIEQGEPVPELTLVYPDISTDMLDGYAEAVKVQAQKHIDEEGIVFMVMDPAADSASAYKQAMKDQIMTHIEPSVALKVEGEDVVFSGVGEGYEALLAFAEITVENTGQGRDSLKTMEVIELNPETLKDADEILIPLTRDGVRSGMRVSPDLTSSRFIGGVISRLEDLVGDR